MALMKPHGQVVAEIALQAATDQVAALEARDKAQRHGIRILCAICTLQAICIIAMTVTWVVSR